jgi:Cu(I)/Ag(I) efflux system protein CusF
MRHSKCQHIAAMFVVVVLALNSPVAAQNSPLVSGQVTKVDPSAKKITIRHGPIKNLDMNEKNMTMVFAVQDPALLQQVKPGDKIKFAADRVNGVITVTAIQK